MSTWTVILIILFFLIIIPKGRHVLVIFLGLFYIPLQYFFLYLQKINFSLKDGDPLLYYLSCIIIYPLYGLIIVLSTLYDMFSDSVS